MGRPVTQPVVLLPVSPVELHVMKAPFLRSQKLYFVGLFVAVTL
jgi:hypothetical protein